ncbi:MAG: SEC-C metal-binding domain-containing protein [Candidatus Woesearchaeota archaeon]
MKTKRVNINSLPTIEFDVNGELKRFRLFYDTCQNPDCDCRGVTICLLGDYKKLGFFVNFDLEIDKSKKYNETEIEIIKAFIKFITSEENKEFNLDFFRDFYDGVRKQAKIRKGEINSFQLGRLMNYCSIFGQDKCFEMDIGGKKYKVFDSYCVNPDCDCKGMGIHFFENLHNIGPRKEDFSFTYAYLSGAICESQGISQKQAEDIAGSFTEGLKRKFGVRHRRLKKEVRRDVQKKITDYERKYKPNNAIPAAICSMFNGEAGESRKARVNGKPHFQKLNVAGKRKLGRNEPCHCGSGRKYKRCCLDRDMDKYGRAMRV